MAPFSLFTTHDLWEKFRIVYDPVLPIGAASCVYFFNTLSRYTPSKKEDFN